jgi:Tfp pilus assembly protein PilZ
VHYSEKRAHNRNLCKLPATVEEIKDSFLYRARLVNFSNTGMFLETDVVLDSETEIVVGIENSPLDSSTTASISSASGSPGRYRAKVVWQRNIQGSIFNFGYGVHIITEEDKKSSQAGDFQKNRELRKYPRRSYAKSVYFSAENQYYKGLVTNISRRGVFIETKDEFEVGQIIKLVIPGTRIDDGAMLKGEVAHCRLTGIGVEFKSLLRKKDPIKDRGGRRSGNDRRNLKFSEYSPDMRSGKNRRSGPDRRKLKNLRYRKMPDSGDD